MRSRQHFNPWGTKFWLITLSFQSSPSYESSEKYDDYNGGNKFSKSNHNPVYSGE